MDTLTSDPALATKKEKNPQNLPLRQWQCVGVTETRM